MIFKGRRKAEEESFVMAKKIKFALKMKDGVEVRSFQELQENFDLNQVTAYFLDGRLETWLPMYSYSSVAVNCG